MGIATFAVVDLETTGNQLDYDEIIQIGITFVRQNQVIDTYQFRNSTVYPSLNFYRRRNVSTGTLF